ncbi:hypothetical protein [Caballeronia sordidicola]|uniref:hypothetical protein n=1 Tax=Caballeronia sordidicola TaxID=196367 RepID=UPI00076445D3|nr:hypothetical protein [Caballeronia sordidicola]
MRERLRRALCRLDCAQEVLEATRAKVGELEDAQHALVMARIWSAAELLASEWPDDYLAGAIGRLMTPRVKG